MAKTPTDSTWKQKLAYSPSALLFANQPTLIVCCANYPTMKLSILLLLSLLFPWMVTLQVTAIPRTMLLRDLKMSGMGKSTKMGKGMEETEGSKSMKSKKKPTKSKKNKEKPTKSMPSKKSSKSMKPEKSSNSMKSKKKSMKEKSEKKVKTQSPLPSPTLYPTMVPTQAPSTTAPTTTPTQAPSTTAPTQVPSTATPTTVRPAWPDSMSKLRLITNSLFPLCFAVSD
jgi:outer membrane biosynthesis protein TonB